jgi:hypothetical protein
MTKNPIPFVIAWISTSVFLIAAGRIEYWGFKFMTVAEVLTVCSLVGTVAFTVLAFRAFWKAHAGNTILAAIGLACFPFVLGEIADPNMHGTAIGGLYFYALLSEVTAVVLLLSSAVHAMLTRR